MAARLVDYENAGRSVASGAQKKPGCSFLLYIFAAVVIAGILAAFHFLGDLEQEDISGQDIPIVREIVKDAEFSMLVSVKKTTTVKVVQVGNDAVIFDGLVKKDKPVALIAWGDIRVESKDVGEVIVRIGNQDFSTSTPYALGFIINADAAVSAYSMAPTALPDTSVISTSPKEEFTDPYTLTVFVSEPTHVKIIQQADGKVLLDETVKPAIPATAVARSAITVRSNNITTVRVQVGSMNYVTSSPDAPSFIVSPGSAPRR